MIRLRVLIVYFITCLCVQFRSTLSMFDPCTSKGNFGDGCDKNDDCVGFGVVCSADKCQCHPDYQEKVDQTLGFKYCSKLPDRIGSACVDKCKLPMFCNSGKCECIRSIVFNNDTCYTDSKLGESCNKNYDCTMPFSVCVTGTCQCMQGTNRSGDSCVTTINCPTGAKPSSPCYRSITNPTIIKNYANSGSQADNCTDGFYCYAAADSSLYGVCCPVTCPLSMSPDSRYTCGNGQKKRSLKKVDKSQCPLETHVCHRFVGQSFSTKVCCRKPCLEPTPLLINNQCYPRSFLGGDCSVNDQCDGNYGMQCPLLANATSKSCTCKPGFKPKTDNTTSIDKNPAQICVKECSPGELAYNGECFKPATIQQQCTLDQQCSQGARCFRGLCICDCSKNYRKVGDQCLLPETRTIRPILLASTPPSLIDIIRTLFGTNIG